MRAAGQFKRRTDLYCAGCGREEWLFTAVPKSRAAYGAGYRLVAGFGWLCMDCQRAVAPTEIRGDIHAETGS